MKSHAIQNKNGIKMNVGVSQKNYQPGSKTSGWPRNDVSLYVPAMSQVRLKWNTEHRLSGTSPRRLSGASPRGLIRMSWRRLRGVMATSHQYVSTKSKTSLKWNTQRRLSSTSSRRTIGTYLGLPFSTSIGCLP